jgi:hypothetical protein
MEPTKDELRVLTAVAAADEVTLEDLARQLGMDIRAVARLICTGFAKIATDVDTGQVAQDLREQWLREEGGVNE